MNRALASAGLLLGLALLASPAAAQTGTARGKVVDPSGTPVVEATVTIDFKGGINRSFQTRTSKKGEYMQVGLQSGPYEITAAKEGYQPALMEVRISIGEPTKVPDIVLTPAVEVKGTMDNLRAAFGAAVDLQNAGKFAEAEAAYKAIMETSPDVPEVHYNLGNVYYAQKQNEAAEAAFLKALELRTDYADAMNSLAKLYQSTGRGEQALELVAKTAGDTQDAKGQFNRGLVLMGAGKPDEAAKAFEATVAVDPAFADAWFWLGSQYLNLGRNDDAANAYEKYLALKPGNPQQEATAAGILGAIRKK